MLTVHHDRFPGQLGEVDVMPAPAEAQVDAAMNEPLARHPLAETGLVQKIDAAVFEHAGANASLTVRARARLDDDRFDPGAMKQVREEQTRRTRADDSNLSVHSG